MENLLSIVVPVYNVERYIRGCLNSLIEVDRNINVEIIIVNDGSKDSSIDVAKSYLPYFHMAKIVSQENQGLSAARNTGFRHANGNYLYFLDSDDYLNVQEFCLLYEKMLKSGADCAVGDYYYVCNGSKQYSNLRINTQVDLLLNGKDFFCDYYSKIDTPVWRCIYRKEFLEKERMFFSVGIEHEDVNWSPKVYVLSNAVLYVPIPIYNYVIRNNSIQHSTFTHKKRDSLIFVYSDLLSFFSNQDVKLQKASNRIITNFAFVIMGLSLTNNIYTNEVRRNITRLIRNNLSSDLRTFFMNKSYSLFPRFVEKLVKSHFKKYKS